VLVDAVDEGLMSPMKFSVSDLRYRTFRTREESEENKKTGTEDYVFIVIIKSINTFYMCADC